MERKGAERMCSHGLLTGPGTGHHPSVTLSLLTWAVGRGAAGTEVVPFGASCPGWRAGQPVFPPSTKWDNASSCFLGLLQRRNEQCECQAGCQARVSARRGVEFRNARMWGWHLVASHRRAWPVGAERPGGCRERPSSQLTYPGAPRAGPSLGAAPLHFPGAQSLWSSQSHLSEGTDR